MKIFTKEHFIDCILTPSKMQGQKTVAWGMTIGLGVASFATVQLVCLILKACFSKKQHVSSKKVSVSNSHHTSDAKVSSVSGQSLTPQKKSTLLSFDSKHVSVSEGNDFSGTEWVMHPQLLDYFTYMGARYPKMVTQEARTFPIKTNEIEQSIDCSAIANADESMFPYYINIGSHWVLVLIDKEKRTVEYYDSKKSYGNYSSIQNQLQNVASKLSEKDSTLPPFQFVRKTNVSLQPDSYQCGVWVMYFLTKRLEDPNFDCDQLDVDQAQTMIADFRHEAMQKIEKMFRALGEVYDKKLQRYEEEYGVSEANAKLNEEWNKLSKNNTKPIHAFIVRLREWNQLKTT